MYVLSLDIFFFSSGLEKRGRKGAFKVDKEVLFATTVKNTFIT